MKVRIEICEAKLVWNGNIGSTPVCLEYDTDNPKDISLALVAIGQWPLAEILEGTADGHKIGSVVVKRWEREVWTNPDEVVAIARAVSESILNVVVIEESNDA